ncbi:large ribosomal subunit protein mL49-like [Liolophura sinensis]|uniref:large ribosomal subunit protein mL49-like n=1 Tax=Liolophura sinensis TaxID=3198878 RepID=UPI0031590925
MALLRQACCHLWRNNRVCNSKSALLTSADLCQPASTYTDYEVSKEEFKFVERLLPNYVIPDPPKHEEYPTPSGWVPPAENIPDLPYSVRRTRHHNLPVYFELRGNRKLTKVRGIYGDIWAFEADLRAYLEEKAGKKLYTQVHEVARLVRVKGSFVENTSDFLVQQGF